MTSSRRTMFICVATSLAVVLSLGIVAAPNAAEAVSPPAPPLIIDYNRVPAASIPAVQRLEDRALGEVLTDYGLPVSDGAAVRGWARNEVRAQLWADLAATIAKNDSARTADEKSVYAWFQSVVQTNNVKAAQGALNEYFKFSGRTTADYLDPEAWALPFGPGGTGYCNYHMPAPYSAQYTGNLDPICFSPPTLNTLFNFLPATPSYEQFVTIGSLAANQSLGTSSDFTTVSIGTSGALATGLALGGTSAAVPIAQILGQGSVAAEKIASEIFPYAGRAFFLTEEAAAAAAEAGAETAAIGGSMAAGAVVAIVGAVVEVLVTTILASIQIAQNDALPKKLHDLLTGAQTVAPDLHTQVTDTALTADQRAANYGAYYTLFLDATTPEARPGCTDTGIIVGGGVYNIDCANAPAAPAPVASDPVWSVTPDGSATSTLARTISVKDRYRENLTAYVSGPGWFVAQKAHSISGTPGALVPSLRLPYIDWSGKTWVATRNGVTGNATLPNGRTFVVTPEGEGHVATDCPTGGCVTSSLQVTRPDGSHATVSLVDAPVQTKPAVTPVYPGTIIAGQAATFSVDGPDATTPGTTFTWTFPCGASCPIPLSGPPITSVVQTGAVTSYAFPEAGAQTVKLQATSNLGAVQTSTFTVNVGQAIGQVFFAQPPDLQFDHNFFVGTFAHEHLDVYSNASWTFTLTVAPESRNVCEVTTLDGKSSSYATGLVVISGHDGATVYSSAAGTCTITTNSGAVLPWTLPPAVTRSFQITKQPYLHVVAYGPVQYSDPLPDQPSALSLAPGGTTGQLTGCTWPTWLADASSNIAVGPGYYGHYGCTGLTNPDYAISYNNYVQVTPESATLVNTTQPSNNPGTASLSATLQETSDGTPGDLTKARVDFLLFASGNSGNTPDFVARSVAVGADGNAAAVLTGLPVDTYRLEVQTGTGSWYSAPAVTDSVSVLPALAPVIVQQPGDVKAKAGTTANFAASATGRATPTVQWQVSTDGGNRWTPIGGANAKTLRVLHVTTSQSGSRFRAVFANSLGAVPTSSAKLTVTAAAPSAPRSVVGTPGVKSTVVTWAVPADSGGTSITGYTVTATPGGRTCATTTARVCTVTALKTGVAYRFSVRAKNKVGIGSASSLSEPVTVGAPTSPRSLTVSFPSAHNAKIAWQAPARVNSGSVTSYQVRWSTDLGHTWSTWTSTKLVKTAVRGSLVKGHSYEVQVRALNKVGQGAAATTMFVQVK